MTQTQKSDGLRKSMALVLALITALGPTSMPAFAAQTHTFWSSLRGLKKTLSTTQ